MFYVENRFRNEVLKDLAPLYSCVLAKEARHGMCVYGNGNYWDRIRPLVISVSDLLLNGSF